ncbi:MAG: hypothetical protein N2663_03980 [Chlorobi bacterium]|nr:hypothetical protein [Chlorobiota bacterium]
MLRRLRMSSANRLCPITLGYAVVRRTLIAAAVCVLSLSAQNDPRAYDTNAVIVTRRLSKELFDRNSIPFMEPLVTTVNATSNARFFRQAAIPDSIERPYIRFGIHSMLGFVRDDQRTYRPTLPTLAQPVEYAKYVEFRNGSFVLRDTAGLAVDLVKRLFHKSVDSGHVRVPAQAPTVFGYAPSTIEIDREYLHWLIQNDPEFAPLYALLPESSRNMIDSLLLKLPSALSLPPGQDMRTIVAAVPQIEIGSLWGTELLLRYIPPVVFDQNIGRFSFWGIGMRHSISQYLRDPFLDVAVQIGYQGTLLRKAVGVTNAQLEARGEFLLANIHASRRFEGIVDIYTGIGYEQLVAHSSYRYTLPQELQIQLGLLKVLPDGSVVRDPANGYPGDDVVQESTAQITVRNVKWTIGLARSFGPVTVCVDYNLGSWSLLSFGVDVQF